MPVKHLYEPACQNKSARIRRSNRKKMAPRTAQRMRVKMTFVIIALCATAASGILFRPSGAALSHICMITSHRKTAYVQDTATAILAQLTQLPAATAMTMSIVVAADSLASLGGGALVRYARKLQPRQLTSDCLTQEEDTDPLPPCRVRQQGLDVVGALEMCRDENPGAAWIVLLEDDFAPCGDGALAELAQTLGGIDPATVKFVRFTQGGGGVAFPRGSVPPYARSVREHIGEVPHDRALSALQWSQLPDHVLPMHLFKHVGRVSTIDYRNSDAYTLRYASIRDNECGSPIAV